MEGALAKVKVIISNSPTAELSPILLSKLLKDFIDKEQTIKKLTVEEIQAAVAKKYGVTVQSILSTERTASLVTPRQLAMYISRKFTAKSLPEIAEKFEKKHATILHGVKTIQKRLDVENDLKQTLEEILSEFGYKLTDGKDLSLS
jgi:chromosomal replication initiator protein